MDFNINYNNGYIYRGAIPFFLKNMKNIIYVSSSNRNIENYYYVLQNISKKTVFKVEYGVENHRNSIGEKYNFIETLEKKDDFIILMSLNSALDDYSDESSYLVLENDKEYSIKQIKENVTKKGYKNNYLIEKKGEFSIRGDIFDIFPINSDYPVRIEFFGDTVESIRYFNIDTQRSIENIRSIKIFSYFEIGNKKSIFDILKSKKHKIYLENIELIDYKLEELILLNRDREDITRKRFEKLKEISNKINIKGFSKDENEKFKNSDYIKSLTKVKNIHIISEEKKRYKEIYNNIRTTNYPLYEGFEQEDELILTDRELKGVKVKKIERRKEGIRLKDINQIVEKDFVIHETFGVGIYLGIEELEGKDYIKIRYADKDKLYVPVDNINRIQKYIAEPGKIPDIYKLGTKGFSKKKNKLKKDIMEFAKNLIEIQAKRNLTQGYKFSKDSIMQEEFEEAFPYKETEGQLDAIYDVKEDMESYKTMDRVVCGDVGYGKTEVALRAAFKSVIDGKQVAFLAPTTVLVHQHYERFIERFKNYPIIIKTISRLSTKSEQKKILNELIEEKIDIIIGTHRLTQKDIEFNDLGLLIIDEEQKFGVKAKEQIKKYKNNIDILTLTATPIPRTLNLALLGIKDISIIETPPQNRKSIETQFFEHDLTKIRDAILKELSREGQVYYVFNRVKGIQGKIAELEKILPEYVRITYIHGQMESSVIKENIEKFEKGEYDVLVTTTIIENGIDIENVNTIIIENFDKFGLSQIYQLRGRVGRGNKQAYCILLYNWDRGITKNGKNRIQTLKDMQDLGAGFQLSLEDMKIRGVGDILGEKQHGALEILGYDMYMKMLNEEIDNLNGIDNLSNIDVILDIQAKGYIPDSYIIQVEKIKIYRRIIFINNIDEIKSFFNEIEDRFGKAPDEVKSLFKYFEIKILAKKKGIKEIKESEKMFKIKFNLKSINFNKISKLIKENMVKYNQNEQAIELSNTIDLNEFIKNNL